MKQSASEWFAMSLFGVMGLAIWGGVVVVGVRLLIGGQLSDLSYKTAARNSEINRAERC